MQTTLSFLVRVWRDLHGLRASACDVRQENGNEFDDLAALTAFLCTRVAAGGIQTPSTKPGSAAHDTPSGVDAGPAEEGTAPVAGKQDTESF